MYYTWVERSWRGGQRMMVVDAVNNNVICALPVTPGQGTCDDMATVRAQVAETRKLQAFIDAGLDEVYDLGIRSTFLCHKFDNALCGVRFDEGTQGTVVNLGNFLNTGTWWNPGPCEGQARDNTIDTGVLPKELMTKASLPAVLPVYPEGPHCNRRGLTDLGSTPSRG